MPKSVPPEEFRPVVEAYLADQKISVLELARRSGVPQPNLSRWLKGENLSLRNLTRLADAVGYRLVLEPRLR